MDKHMAGGTVFQKINLHYVVLDYCYSIIHYIHKCVSIL